MMLNRGKRAIGRSDGLAARGRFQRLVCSPQRADEVTHFAIIHLYLAIIHQFAAPDQKAAGSNPKNRAEDEYAECAS